MGKSIVHCSECGKAVREDDLAKGQASVLDARTYCGACRPVPPSAPPAEKPLKRSTSRIPLTRQTPRKAFAPVKSSNPRFLLWGAGALLGFGLILVLALAFSGKRTGPGESDSRTG